MTVKMLPGIQAVFRQESLLIPVFLYGLTKLILPTNNNNGDLKNITLNIIRPTIALILTMPLFLILCLCAFYFEIIRFVAKLKFGTKYFDHFRGADAVWSFDQRVGSSIFTSLHLYEDQGPQTPKKLFNFTRTKAGEVAATHPRFNCIRESFMGFFFFVKENIDLDQTHIYLDTYKDYESFKQVVNELATKPMPHNGKYLLQFCIGKTLIEVEPGRFVYPMVTRVHHSFTDGVTLTALLVSTHVDGGFNKMKEIYDESMKMFKQEVQHDYKRLGKKQSIWNYIWNKQIYFHHDVLQHVEPSNVLHNKPVTTEKLLSSTLEGADENYFNKVKEIKKKLNVSHSDVVLGAVAASLTEHYSKHELDHPSFISTGTTFFLKGINFDDLIQMKNNEPITNLGNKFTVGHSKIPINDGFLNDPKKFIFALNQQTTSLRKALDMLFFYWVLNINCTIVPQQLATFLLDLFDCTAISTNVPGSGEIVLSNGCKLVDAYAWSIHYKRIGVCIGVYTFKNRLRITLHVDKTFVKEEKHAQVICDNFFKYIDKIYDSVQ